MKIVLVSTRPFFCDLISNGRKGIEVRKSFPKDGAPFKGLLYQTASRRGVGAVIGEFICTKVMRYTKVGFDGSYEPPRYMRHNRAGMVFDMSEDLQKMCLSKEQFEKYANGGDVYGWVISDFKHYEEPKPLSDFGLDRAPQSWCYITTTDAKRDLTAQNAEKACSCELEAVDDE